MRFVLEGILKFNRDIEFLEHVLPEIVAKEVNMDIFRRGLRRNQEGARLSHWRASGLNLFVTIEGGDNLRAHEAFVIFKNYLIEKLGKEHNVNVTSFIIRNYDIYLRPSLMSRGKIDLKYPGVKDIRFKNNEIMVRLQDISSDQIEDRFVEKILKGLEEKFTGQAS